MATPNANFESTSKSFLDWFTSQPGTTFHPSLQITDLRHRNAGRGIITTADIPPETDLFTIPRNAIISVETSELAKKLPELFSQQPGPTAPSKNDDDKGEDGEEADPSDLPTPWLNLILILLYESLHTTTSRFTPYLSVLPSHPSSFNTLMFWTPEDLSHLQASAIPSKIGRDAANAMFHAHILPVVRRHADVFFPDSATTTQPSDADLLGHCHVIGSLIMSYAFDLQPDTDSDSDSDSDNPEPNAQDGWTDDTPKPSTLGMVPMADILNADAEFNAHLSHGDDALTMTSLRTIRAGEEVLNYYGPLPNGELLRRYGYVSAAHARYDVCEVGWGVVRGMLVGFEGAGTNGEWREQAEREVARMEDEGEVDADDGFVLERESGDPDETGMCTVEASFTKFPEELVEIVGDVVGRLLQGEVKKRKMPGSEERKLVKRRTLEVLRGVVLGRVKQYGTTLAEDEELLQRADVEGRMRMAVEVRMGEKRLLREALSWTDGMIRKYSDETANTNGSSREQPARKKMKR